MGYSGHTPHYEIVHPTRILKVVFRTSSAHFSRPIFVTQSTSAPYVSRRRTGSSTFPRGTENRQACRRLPRSATPQHDLRTRPVAEGPASVVQVGSREGILHASACRDRTRLIDPSNFANLVSAQMI